MASTHAALMPGSFPGKEQVEENSLSMDTSPYPGTWKRYESEEEEISDPESNEPIHFYSPIDGDDSEPDLSDYQSMSEPETFKEVSHVTEKESVNERVASTIRMPCSRPVSIVTIGRNSIAFERENEIPDSSFNRMSMMNPRLSAILQGEGIDLDMEILEATSISYVTPPSPPNLVMITQRISIPPRSSKRTQTHRDRRSSPGRSGDRGNVKKRSSTAVSRFPSGSPDPVNKRHSRIYLQNPLHSTDAQHLLDSEPNIPRAQLALRKDILSPSGLRSTDRSKDGDIGDYIQDRGRKRSKTHPDGPIGDPAGPNLRRVSGRIGIKPILTVYEPKLTIHSFDRDDAMRSMSCNRLGVSSLACSSTGLPDEDYKVSPILLDRLVHNQGASLPCNEEDNRSGNVDSILGFDADTTFSTLGQGSCYNGAICSDGSNTSYPDGGRYRSSTTTTLASMSVGDDVKMDAEMGSKLETTTPPFPKLRRTLQNLRLRRR